MSGKRFAATHLQQWKSACIEATGEQSKPLIPANQQDKKRSKAIEKELQRKEKTLAETAALLVLSKKFNTFYWRGRGAMTGLAERRFIVDHINSGSEWCAQRSGLRDHRAEYTDVTASPVV